MEIPRNNQNEEILIKTRAEVIETPPNDFLELSLINEIKQTIEQLEVKCQGKIGEEIVEERCRQLAYVRVLVDVYKKETSLLIKPTAHLGEAYYDIRYFAQAREHLENAIKINEECEPSDNSLSPGILLTLTIKLSKSYLETEDCEASIKLAERALEETKKIYGESDVGNSEIYEILYKANKKLSNYGEAIRYLNLLFDVYEKIHGHFSEQCADVYKEIGFLYELSKDIPMAIEFYKNYYNSLERIINDNKNYEQCFQLAIKISELYVVNKEYDKAYELLKKNEKSYSSLVKRSLKNRVIYQRCIIKICSFFNDTNKYLDELLILENILKESNENQKALAKTYMGIAHIYKQNKKYEKSQEYFKKADEIFDEHNDKQLSEEAKKQLKEVQKELDKI